VKICQLCAVDFTLYHFLLPLLRALRAAGHDPVAVAAEGPLLAEVRAEGFRVETVPFVRGFNPVAHLRAAAALVPIFRRERFDLVHTHTPIAGLIGRIAAKIAGVPRIAYTAHGFYFHERMSPAARAFFVALEWIGGRMTDILLTQAQEDAATARRLKLCAGTIAAIGNGVDPAKFSPSSDPARRAGLRAGLGLAPGAVAIAAVGRLVAEKGYVELFEAMREVDATLLVVGERLPSDHAGSIARTIDAVKTDPILARRIRFLGYRKDVAEILRACDLFVLASHREGMPRSIIEAMMTGLPVVATDIRGAREEVVPEETGLLVRVSDAQALAASLGRLVRDAASRARMGQAGLARARALYDEAAVLQRQLALLGLAPGP
jgi:glycosyltransferase involved in cell wall biosynthesis